MTEEPQEKLPISDFYKVIDYVTIFKSEKWWEAIVVFESYGKRQIGMYLWQKRKEKQEEGEEQKEAKTECKWKRKHKFNVRDLEEWNKLKNAIEQLAPKLAAK
jgi:DNA topoisomerase IA